MKISVKTRVAAAVLSTWALGIASTSGADDSRVIRSSGSELGRISYWYGKVNAHKAAGGAWLKDPDCMSGANIDPLTYCRKFFPGTTSVTEVALTAKPSNLWNTASCGLTYSGNGAHEWICNGESTPARPATSLRPQSTTSPMRSARTVSFRLVSEGAEEPMRHRAFTLCDGVPVTHVMHPQCADPLGRMETDEEGRFVLDLRDYPTTMFELILSEAKYHVGFDVSDHARTLRVARFRAGENRLQANYTYDFDSGLVKISPFQAGAPYEAPFEEVVLYANTLGDK